MPLYLPYAGRLLYDRGCTPNFKAHVLAQTTRTPRRVDVSVQKLNESVEWLTYEFSDQTHTSTVISLQSQKV